MPAAETTEHCCVHNQRSNPLAVDPTHTTTIRRRFEADVRRRMGKLKSHLREFLVGLDALGMKERHSFVRMAQPREFEFLTNPAKLLEFNAWFTRQVQQDVFSVPAGTPSGVPWTAQYVESAYKRGQINAYLQSKQAAFADSVGVGDVSQEQFLRDSFNAPERMSKVQLLATRSFEQLKGVTSQMGSDMNRILSQGMIDGKGPAAIAKEMAERIDGLTSTRAMLIARTEIVHAHAEGQLDAYTDLGVEELGVQAEWSTAGDDRVCEQCAGMEGEVFTVKEAHGLIPFHPNCRCSWLPYDSELISKEAVKKVADGDTMASAQPDIEGHSMVSIIRTAGSQGWDYRLTKKVLNDAGFFPNDNTIRIQLRAGKLGHGTTVSPEVLDKLRRGEIVGPGPVVPPPPPVPPPPGPTPPPPEPVPPPPPVVVEIDLPSTVTIIRQAGNQGMSFAETKAMLNAVGLTPADATIRTQLRLGKLGQGTMVEPGLFDRIRRGEVRARGTAPSTTPTPEPEPKPLPKSTYVDIRKETEAEFRARFDAALGGFQEKIKEFDKKIGDTYADASLGVDERLRILRELRRERRAAWSLEKETLMAEVERSRGSPRSTKMDLMKQPTPQDIYYGTPTKEEKARLDQVKKVHEEATDFLQRVVPAERLHAIPKCGVEYSMGVRAFYSPSDQQMTLDPLEGANIQVHEYGHHLQNTDRKVMEREIAFLLKRGGGKDVVFKKGHEFDHYDGNHDFVFSAIKSFKSGGASQSTAEYTTKIYNKSFGGSSWTTGEVLSMGLQRMQEDIAEFYRNDPEYFRHVLLNVQRPVYE